ncbi:methyltransferase [Brenneria goodwinii]|nr:methyltransferase [Brenneria goodwinii]
MMVNNSGIKKVMEIMIMPLAAKALYVAAEIGIADKITPSGTDISSLAKQCDCNEKNLFDLIKVLTIFGFFKIESNGAIMNTEMSQLLLSDQEQSMRNYCRLFGNEYYRGFDGLMHTCMTGESGFLHVFGENLYSYLSKSNQRSEVYDLAMRDLSRPVGALLAKEYEGLFNTVNKVIDIGGGSGIILTEIIKRNSHVIGCLFDREDVCTRSENSWKSLPADVKSRLKVTAGSFFDDIPAGYDVYLIKNILHNWNDESCLSILKEVKRAISESENKSTVLVIEPLLDENELSPKLLFNALFQSVICQDGTRHRTLEKINELAAMSGLHMAGFRKIATNHTVVELVLPNHQ